MNWNMPPRRTKDDGNPRLVGFELEFSGVDLSRLGEIISSLYGGTLSSKSVFEYTVADTEFGDFTLEVDSIQLKDRKYKQLMDSLGFELPGAGVELLDEALYDLAKIAVPFELVTPPIPIYRIDELSGMEKALRDLNAKGTRASFLYGFGMQFNPEIPALTPETILAYMRSFFLLLDHLKQEINVDLTRRILPFIHDFPEDYIRKVLHPDYAPDMGLLIDDYMAFNPTRNRPLDMTCMFAHLDKERTLAQVKEPKLVKPRPTFHYRLPDCRIDEKEWSMAKEWNRWVEVEELASDPETLRKKSLARLKKSSSNFGG